MDLDTIELLMEAREAARSGRGERLREAAGLSKGEIAAVVGVSQPAICRWEAGERRPTGEPAIAYARLLRTLADHLAAAEDHAGTQPRSYRK